MKWRLPFAVVALAMSAGASAAAAPRIVSMNICTDQMLLALADPAQIIGLSRFSRDGRQGWVEGAQKFPILSGGAEDILVLKPDVVTASQFDKRSTRELLKANGVNLVELPVPRIARRGARADPRDGQHRGPSRARRCRNRAA